MNIGLFQTVACLSDVHVTKAESAYGFCTKDDEIIIHCAQYQMLFSEAFQLRILITREETTQFHFPSLELIAESLLKRSCSPTVYISPQKNTVNPCCSSLVHTIQADPSYHASASFRTRLMHTVTHPNP